VLCILIIRFCDSSFTDISVPINFLVNIVRIVMLFGIVLEDVADYSCCLLLVGNRVNNEFL